MCYAWFLNSWVWFRDLLVWTKVSVRSTYVHLTTPGSQLSGGSWWCVFPIPFLTFLPHYMAERNVLPGKQKGTRRLISWAAHPGSTKIIIPVSLTLLPTFEAMHEGAKQHRQERQCKNGGSFKKQWEKACKEPDGTERQTQDTASAWFFSRPWVTAFSPF